MLSVTRRWTVAGSIKSSSRKLRVSARNNSRTYYSRDAVADRTARERRRSRTSSLDSLTRHKLKSDKRSEIAIDIQRKLAFSTDKSPNSSRYSRTLKRRRKEPSRLSRSTLRRELIREYDNSRPADRSHKSTN